MTDYWKSFWLAHGKESQHTELQVQVLRTLNKQPVAPEAFAAILDSVSAMLKPEPDIDLLDLCCGNGLITKEFISSVRSVTAVDLSEELVSKVKNGTSRNVTTLAADARTVSFPDNSFDRILLYAGLQYFSEIETVELFQRLRRWIRNGGLVVLGDIPDATRRWDFFNSPERENAYFDGLKADKPLVGHWFDPSWLEKLANYAGFVSAALHPQPATLPYQHYRFDLVLAS